MKYTFIDLFAGTGAFSKVLENYDCKCVFANDIVTESKEVYTLNCPPKAFKLGDLNDIDINDIPTHDILCGGFPCQPFSIAGKRLGFDDDRSNVFWKILKIIKKHKPQIILLENVKNLLSHDNNNTFKIIQTELTKLGYNIKYKVLDTNIITAIPQHRERIYIVGFLNKNMYDKFSLNFEKVTQKINIIDLLQENVPDKYYYTDKLKVYDTINSEIKKNINTNTIYQYRRHYIRENKSNCCPTLTANMGSGGHNVPLIKDDKGIRKLTPRECFNLQGFPKTFKLPEQLSDSKLYKLAGNAVSIPVINLIVKQILLLHV